MQKEQLTFFQAHMEQRSREEMLRAEDRNLLLTLMREARQRTNRRRGSK